MGRLLLRPRFHNAGAEAQLNTGRASDGGKVRSSQQRGDVNRLGPAEDERTEVRQCVPDLFDSPLWGTEVNEDQASRGCKDAVEFPEYCRLLSGRDDVDEVAGEGCVKCVGVVRESVGLLLAQGISVVIEGGGAAPGAAEHGRSCIDAFGPARGILGQQGAEGQTRSDAYFEHVLSILDVEPPQAQGSAPVGDPGSQQVIHRCQGGVDSLERLKGGSRRGRRHDYSRTGRARTESIECTIAMGGWRRNLRNDFGFEWNVCSFPLILRFRMDLEALLHERLQHYRPVLDRVIFGLSLVGVLVVVHLMIQKARNFEQGCTGIASLGASEEQAFDCSTVLASSAGQFLGLSNLTWGLGFYIVVALLTVAIFFLRPAIRRWVQGGRVGLLTAGLLYSGYLVYVQATQIEAFCALCLASAVVVALLFGTQVGILATSPSSSDTVMSSRFQKHEIVLYVYFVAFAAVLIGADLTYFSSPESAQQKATATNVSNASAQCQLDTTREPIGNDGASLVRFQDIIEGPSDAEVTVIEYFDPNCPHCKTFHDTIETLKGEYGDEVRFVFKPFPLRATSLPEIQALYVAHEEGKFSEMLQGQFARQGAGGLGEQDLREIASEIDMNPDALMSQVQQNEYRDQVVQQRQRAIKIGVDSTPTVLVNGHFVASRSLECMRTYIEEAQEGTLGS